MEGRACYHPLALKLSECDVDSSKLTEMVSNLDSHPVWNIEPELINAGPFDLSFYPIALAIGLVLGYFLRRQVVPSQKAGDRLRLAVGIVAILSGGVLLLDWIGGIPTAGPGGIRDYVLLLAMGWLSGMSSFSLASQDSSGSVEKGWRNTLLLAGAILLVTLIGHFLIPAWGAVGPLKIRFYGVLFASGLFLGYLLWRWQMVQGGHSLEIAERYLVWGVLAVLIGSRLGHCLFYEPEIYLKNPIKILFVWEGGLASHGATLGLVVSMWLYSKRYQYSFLEMIDRLAMPATMGALFVRLGNFMNSEIVGKVWDGPWAVRFPRYTQINQNILESRMGRALPFEALALPRHPSQLYEALGAIIIFGALLLVNRVLKERRPRGLMGSLFLMGYFLFRFLVEFFKEFQSLANLRAVDSLRVIYVEPTAGITMGQWLSVPFFAAGVALFIYALKKKDPASHPSPLD